MFERQYVIKKLKDIGINQPFIREIQKTEPLNKTNLYTRGVLSREIEYECIGTIIAICLNNGVVTILPEDIEVILMNAELDASPKSYEQ